MTGRYAIYPRLDLAPCDLTARQWGTFVATCRSLARDKLDYTVKMEPIPVNGGLRVLIEARGKATPKRRHVPKIEVAKPALTVKDCQGRLKAAQARVEILRQGFARRVRAWREQSWPAPTYDPTKAARRRIVGAAVAKVIAKGLSNRDASKVLDTALGFRVARYSELGTYAQKQGYLQTIVARYADGRMRDKSSRKSAPKPPEPPFDYARELAEARAEVDFWRECEALARGRSGGLSLREGAETCHNG